MNEDKIAADLELRGLIEEDLIALEKIARRLMGKAARRIEARKKHAHGNATRDMIGEIVNALDMDRYGAIDTLAIIRGDELYSPVMLETSLEDQMECDHAGAEDHAFETRRDNLMMQQMGLSQ